jgi:hypothetical protein
MSSSTPERTGSISKLEPRLLAPLLFAPLLVATLLTLFLVERERDEPRFIDNVTVTGSFDPEGAAGQRSARLRFRLTQASTDVDVRVVDEAGSVGATLIEGRAMDDFEFHDFRWHGELDGGGLAPAGEYRFQLDLVDLGRVLTIPDPIEVIRSEDPGTGN